MLSGESAEIHTAISGSLSAVFFFHYRLNCFEGLCLHPENPVVQERSNYFPDPMVNLPKKFYMTTTLYIRAPGNSEVSIWNKYYQAFFLISHKRNWQKHSLRIWQIHFLTIGYSLSKIVYFSILIQGTNYRLYSILSS